MELRHLRHFIAVAETGSFTKAAQRANVSQPALSASVAKLESEYQVKLLDRRRTRVVPTPAGRLLLDRGNAILQASYAVRAQLRARHMGNPVRVGVLRTFASQPVSRLIAIFGRMYPEVQTTLSDGTMDELMTSLADDQIDVAIGRLDNPDPRFDSNILFKEPFIMAVPNDHRFAHESSVRLTDLEGESFIARTGCEVYAQATKLLKDLGVNVTFAYKTDHDQRALSLVAAGIGVAIIPEQFEAKGVTKVPISDHDFTRTIGIYYDSGNMHAAVENFLMLASTHNWRSRQA